MASYKNFLNTKHQNQMFCTDFTLQFFSLNLVVFASQVEDLTILLAVTHFHAEYDMFKVKGVGRGSEYISCDQARTQNFLRGNVNTVKVFLQDLSDDNNKTLPKVKRVLQFNNSYTVITPMTPPLRPHNGGINLYLPLYANCVGFHIQMRLNKNLFFQHLIPERNQKL